MWSSLHAFLAAFGKVLSLIADLVEKKREVAAREEAQDSADRIASDPGAEWLRRFGKKTSATTSASDAGKPGADK